MSSVARDGRQRTEQKDARGEETGRTGDDKKRDNSATVTGAGDAGRLELEYGRERDAAVGIGGKGVAVDEAA